MLGLLAAVIAMVSPSHDRPAVTQTTCISSRTGGTEAGWSSLAIGSPFADEGKGQPPRRLDRWPDATTGLRGLQVPKPGTTPPQNRGVGRAVLAELGDQHPAFVGAAPGR